MPDTMSSVKIDAAEIKSFFRIKEIALQPIKGNYDAVRLRKFHKYIFQDSPQHGPGEIRPETQSWHKNRKLEVSGQAYPVRYNTGNLNEKMDKVLRSHGGVAGFKGLPKSDFS